jgi:hypothetical protein
MRFAFLVAIALVTSVGSNRAASAGDSLPWMFNAQAADGYSIKLEAIDPAPGTPLIRGSKVTITVSVTYTMTIAPHGMIVLVPQDEKNRALASGEPQVVQEVSGAGGVATLRQTLVVPLNANEIRLFVPLVPDGLKNTTGEITVRYPVVTEK